MARYSVCAVSYLIFALLIEGDKYPIDRVVWSFSFHSNKHLTSLSNVFVSSVMCPVNLVKASTSADKSGSFNAFIATKSS